jgi:hypothetical protein
LFKEIVDGRTMDDWQWATTKAHRKDKFCSEHISLLFFAFYFYYSASNDLC